MPKKDAKQTEPDWRVFEKLAKRLVMHVFKLDAAVVILTEKTKDGGYDCYIKHELATSESVIGCLEEITLVEAKMRFGSNGIGLRDFAATLVIAHNEFANTLVIVANRPFTPQALKEACRFFSRTNMRVKLVNDATVSGWIRRNYDDLVTDFPESFLRSLILPDSEMEKAQSTSFTSSRDSELFQRVAGQPAKRFSVEMGWHDGYQPASCELVEDAATETLIPETLPPLISKERVKQCRLLETALRRGDGPGNICLLTGAGGVGKSVLVSHLLTRLSAYDDGRSAPWVGRIDVGAANSSRSLFIAILTALLGVDPQLLISGGEDYWEPEKLVSSLVTTSSDDPICKAVVRSLKADLKAYESSWDLNVEPLLTFLNRLVGKRTARQDITLVFHELNRSTEETLDFLVQACRVLSESRASVLLEIRDVGYEQTATTRRVGDAAPAVMSLEHWRQVVSRFRASCTGGDFKIEPPTESEAIEYTQTLLPGLGKGEAQVIVRHVGTIPLHLKLTADWHRAEGILGRHEGGVFLVQDIERFFAEQRITPQAVDIIFDRLIEAWWGRPRKIFGRAITAATLFEGELPLMALCALDAEGDVEALANDLLASGLFKRYTLTHDALKVAHDLVRERMEVFLKTRPFSIPSIAASLLERLEVIFPNPEKRRLREVDLLLALGAGRTLEASSRAHAAANELARTRDWSQAVKYHFKADEALSGWEEKARNDQARILEINNLADWMDVEILRYRIGTSDNAQRMSAFLNLLAFSPDLPMSPVERQVLNLRAAIIEWRYYYVHEHIEDALRVAERGRKLALACGDQIDVEIRGKALANYAVTLKLIDRRDESFAAFDDALKRLPTSYTVIAERLSNFAAVDLRNRPESALGHYRQLLEITRGSAYSFSEIIHAHVDIAMAGFLMNDLDAAKRDAQRAIKLAMDNGVPAQEARGRNILGCVYWLRDELEGADREFCEAAFASERSISHRFLWRMRTNAAGAALALKDTARAYGYARFAEDAIILPRENTLRNGLMDASYVISRWYAALIAIGSYYAALDRDDDLQRLVSRVNLPRFYDHVMRFIDGSPPSEVFNGTTHLRGGKIMITG